MYSAAVRRKAWEIIVLLIWEENTTNLANYLLEWDEADLFLLDILKLMPAGWYVHPDSLLTSTHAWLTVMSGLYAMGASIVSSHFTRGFIIYSNPTLALPYT